MIHHFFLRLLMLFFLFWGSGHSELLIVADRFLPNETVDLRIFYPEFHGDTIDIGVEIGLLSMQFSLHSADTSYFLPYLHRPASGDSLTILSHKAQLSERIDIRSYLPPPRILKKYEAGERYFSVEWDFPHSADSIPIQLALSKLPDFPEKDMKIIETARSPFILKKLLEPGTLYYYRIRAFWENVYSAWTADESFLYQPTNSPPEKPIWLSESDSSGLPKSFLWKKSRDKDNDLMDYELQFLAEDSIHTRILAGTDTLFHLESGGKLQNHRRYLVCIRAIDSLLESSPCDTLIWHSNLKNSAPVWLDDFSLKDYLILQSDTLFLPLFYDAENDTAATAELTLTSINDTIPVWKSRLDFQPKYSLRKLELPDSLPDNEKWRFSLAITDDWGARSKTIHSQLVALDFLPEAPSMPQLIEPKPGVIIQRYPILLKWQASEDPDPGDTADSLYYQLKISADSLGYEIVYFQNSDYGADTMTVDAALADDAFYYLHLRAKDTRKMSSGWSNPVKFFLDLQNNPPGPFSITIPPDTVNPHYIFRWSGSVDPNARDTMLSYFLSLYDENKQPVHTEYLQFANGDSGYWQPSNLLENHRRYHLSLSVADADSAMWRHPDTLRFVCYDGSNKSPTIPLISSSYRGKILFEEDSLFWEAAMDEDNDPIFYQLQLSQSENFDTLLFTLDSLTEQSIRLQSLSGFLKEKKRWHWRIAAYDLWGGISDYSISDWFYYKAYPDPPKWENFSINLTNDTLLADSSYTFKWSPAVQAGVADDIARLSYELQVSEGRHFLVRESYFSENPKQTINLLTIPENQKRFLRIQAIDISGQRSDWTPISRFFTDRLPEAPIGELNPILPENEAVLYRFGQLAWPALADPDPRDTIWYLLKICEDTLEPPLIQTNLRKSLLPYRAGLYQRLDRWRKNSPERDYQYHPRYFYLAPDSEDTLVVQLQLLPGFQKLGDNQLFYWQVEASDKQNHQVSGPWSSFYVNLKNDPPEQPRAILFPLPNDIVSDSTPSIIWKGVKDPDPDDSPATLRYEVSLTDSIADHRSFTTSPGITVWSLSEKLNENHRYTLKIRAIDNQKLPGEWSEPRHFLVNAYRESPLIAPESIALNDSVFNTPFPKLPLGKIVHTDPIDTISNFYLELELWSEDETDRRHHTLPYEKETSFIDTLPLIDNSWYQYRLRVITHDSLYSDWTKNHRFGIDLFPESPLYFELLRPYYKQDDTLSTRPKFSWEKSGDADLNDKIFYRLYISEDSTFFENVTIVDKILDNRYKIDKDNELFENTRYFWKLAAIDETGHYSWGSQSDLYPWEFTIGQLEEAISNGSHDKLDLVFHPVSPNPFNNEVLLHYELPQRVFVELSLYNLRGQKIATIQRRTQSPGEYIVRVSMENSAYGNLPAGIYIFTLKAGHTQIRQKGMYLK
jgi:hypothetical protein